VVSTEENGSYDDKEKSFIPLGFTVSDDGSQRFAI